MRIGASRLPGMGTVKAIALFWLTTGALSSSEPTLAVLQRKAADIIDAAAAETTGLPEVPTIVLAGHHNDGKSALLEALIGVRLTHVGASMITRRPLRVMLQHDASCEEPEIFLLRDSTIGEERVPASEVRLYIEAENARLARSNAFDEDYVSVRLRSAQAPNLVIIDTPGLLSVPPQTSTKADTSLVQASDKLEKMLLAQLTPQRRICICLEDAADWQLSATRSVVKQADPTMCRTILVAPKLDGKLAQFSMPEDLHVLLNPENIRTDYPRLLAGPIFTSVPPMRDPSPTALVDAITRQEAGMRALLVDRLGSDM